jgi:hypothetical protein
MKLKTLFINTVYFLFIAMFLYAAFSKWLGFNVYASQMKHQPFPEWMSSILVWAIPISEVIVVLLMIITKTSKLGLMIATAMMIAFSIYIALILLHIFGDKIPCSCGGAISQFTWPQHLVFNLFFVIMGVIAVYLERDKPNTYSNHQ